MKELELYKMYVAKPVVGSLIVDSLRYGFVTTQPVIGEDLLAINSYFSSKKLSTDSVERTLFTVDELNDLDLTQKVLKQILHYISGGNYGVQEFEIDNRKITFDIVQIVSKEELFEVIKKDIYSNRPLSEDKIQGIYEICAKYEFQIDYSQVKNNEFKVLLLLNSQYKFNSISGDDVMRAIIKLATGNTLLIKSKPVIEALILASYKKEIVTLLSRYITELSEVFNRHKKLILALKTEVNAPIINKISKMSKENHVPIRPALNKVFVNKYLNIQEGKIEDSLTTDLTKLTVVDKMKLINHLDVLDSDMNERVFVIRNGKVFIKEGPYKTNKMRLRFIREELIKSLADDISFLKDKNIKYPENIDYGFPVSEKKSVGNMPFGTVISATGKSNHLVAGMYWRNSWGSHDLDLSSVAIDGSRTGWGQINAYDNGDVLFSGDITNAPDGAIEYMANNGNKPVVLINNIFNGDEGSKFKIVIGEQNDVERSRSNKYIENVLAEISCSFTGTCKNMSLGALYNDRFVLYPLALGSKIVSNKKDKAILPYMLVEYTRLKEILKLAGASINDEEREYDIDLSLENVTFDKLSNILNKDTIDNKVNV